ncbi:MAG: hypothetical protein QM650_05480 [Microlunatus sp.]
MKLRQLLCDAGRTELPAPPPAPRLPSLPDGVRAGVLELYRMLGGVQDEPRLTPGSWDLAYTDGLLIELDEDLHFTRYRGVALDTSWAADLPWTDVYREYVVTGERRAGTGGRRWTSPSAERLFGPADPDGVFGEHGAPRWKQRALYDAMKDAAAASGVVRLARLSIYDRVAGVRLNDVLYGRAEVPMVALAEFVIQRSSIGPACAPGPDEK